MQIKDVTSKIGSGATPTGGDKAYKPSGISLIRSQNVLDMTFSKEGLAHIDEQQARKLDGVTVRPNDVLLNITGDSIARCCIVPENVLPARVNQHVAIVRAEKTSPQYLLCFLQYLKPHLMQICKVGGTRNALTKEAIEELPFWEVDNPDEAVRMLGVLDEALQNNISICSDLEAMAKLLYDYWFVQFDFPDENGKPYKSSGGKMVWNEELKREIPEGWEVKMLPEVVSLQYGFPLATSLFGADGVGVVRIRDILENSISANTTETVSNEYLTQEGDLLVGMDGNFQMNYWTRNGDVVNQRITRIRKCEIPLVIIRMQIEPYINAKIDSVARSTVGHLGDADFKLQRILVPCGIDLQPFDLFLQKIIELRKENQQLASLRDFLLPMLMNGQLKIEQKL